MALLAHYLAHASIGSIIMLLIGGQIVHAIGSKRALQIGSTGVAAYVHWSSSHQLTGHISMFLNILSGASISIYHIASSGHSLHRQDEVGAVIVPKAAWRVGSGGDEHSSDCIFNL